MFVCARRGASFFEAWEDIAMKNNYRFHSDTRPVASCTSHIRVWRQETTHPSKHSCYFKHQPSERNRYCLPLPSSAKTWPPQLDFLCFFCLVSRSDICWNLVSYFTYWFCRHWVWGGGSSLCVYTVSWNPLSRDNLAEVNNAEVFWLTPVEHVPSYQHSVSPSVSPFQTACLRNILKVDISPWCPLSFTRVSRTLVLVHFPSLPVVRLTRMMNPPCDPPLAEWLSTLSIHSFRLNLPTGTLDRYDGFHWKYEKCRFKECFLQTHSRRGMKAQFWQTLCP